MKTNNSYFSLQFDCNRIQINDINSCLSSKSQNKLIFRVVYEVTDTHVALKRYVNDFQELQIQLPIDEANGFFAHSELLKLQRIYINMHNNLDY